jgi:hypothetical protein
MTRSVDTRHPNHITTGSLARMRDGHDRSRHARHHRSYVMGRRTTRRVIATAAVLALAVLAVLLLDAAGFDHRVATGSIAVLTGDVFASWLLIVRANRGHLGRRAVPAHGDNRKNTRPTPRLWRSAVNRHGRIVAPP